MDMLNFENLGAVLDEDEEVETKFEKFGAFHKTNIVFLLDLTHDMLLPSSMKSKESGNAVSLAYACLIAIRQSVLDMIKHSSLGGGSRDRVAILGLMHNKTVVLLGMQLPSAETIKIIDELSEYVGDAPAKQGSAINLAKAFDMAFTLLKDFQGDAQIFICTANDDPCDRIMRKGFSERLVVCSKATDLTQNHMMSIKLLAVPPRDRLKPFDVSLFWQNVASNQGSDDRTVIESLHDLIQHVRSLTRPTAITVPSGSNIKLRVRDPKRCGSYCMQLHVNLYALSRSRDLNPGKSFRIDVDDGSFLAEVRVRDGKIVKQDSNIYAATHEGEGNSRNDDTLTKTSTVDASPQPPQVLFQRKKVLKFRERDIKVWDADELTRITKHGNPRCIDIVGFIQNDRINREFRGQSPQYLTLVKNSEEEEANYWCALWHACRRLNATCIAALYLRESNAPKQILLTPHSEVRDPQGYMRLPNGFYVHHLPYKDRLYVNVRPKQATRRLRTDQHIMDSLHRILQGISKSYFYPLNDRNSDKQWRVLEALALDQAPPKFDPAAIEYPQEITTDLGNLRAICYKHKKSKSLAELSKSKRSRKH
ncbi:hypothetical protein BIW11_08563 [Tropilaelaps mercedesae]|uniref:Ku domain-containing protein n=1 Tax=Tropilaelaps mercedesae TaxID=418985 RepID=A0A1V9XP84_9ACAR|nr:hypothetical protein BIW11_08563 [Tropilaelaps mercedesae]